MSDGKMRFKRLPKPGAYVRTMRVCRVGVLVLFALGCADKSAQSHGDMPHQPDRANGDERAAPTTASLAGAADAGPAVAPAATPAAPEPTFEGPVDVAAGAEHTCAVHAGRVRCWGSNAFHQLGDAALTNGRGVFRAARQEVSGLTRVVALGAGTHHTCALRDSGEALCWGHGGYGQLGDGGREDRPTPVRVPLDGNVRSISGGDGHTCAVVTGGALYCWGRNDHGQLGDGTFAASGTPVRVPLPEDTAEVAAGRLHTCARGESGWVSCWGMHLFGQLGPRVRVAGGHRSIPAAIARLDDAVGLAAGMDHTCALRRSGRVLCWGRNENSQLRLDRLRGLPANTALVLGEGHSCALVPAERLMCVGVNRRQQIAQRGARIGVPLRVRDGEGSVRVAVGYQHTCWVNAAGQIGCRGEPEGGRLGTEQTPVAQPPPALPPPPEPPPETAPAR